MKKNENILRLTKLDEKDLGIYYPDTSSAVYKVFKYLFFLSAAFSLFTSLSYIIGQYIYYSNSGDISRKLLSEFYPDMTLILIQSALLIVAVVFSALNKFVTAFILGLFSSVLGIVKFYSFSFNADHIAGLNTDYWWRHFIPFLLIVICLFANFIVGINAKSKLNKNYNSMLERIYRRFPEKRQEMTDSEWEEFLNSYNPEDFRSKKEKTGFNE